MAEGGTVFGHCKNVSLIIVTLWKKLDKLEKYIDKKVKKAMMRAA